MHACKGGAKTKKGQRGVGTRWNCLPSGVSTGMNEKLSTPNALLTADPIAMSDIIRGRAKNRAENSE